MDRRHFMAMGGAAAATFGAVAESLAAPQGPGQSIADFGVEPASDRDQSAALQKAVDALASAGQPIIIPAGIYHAQKVQLPIHSVLVGTPGLSILVAPQGAAVFEAQNKQNITLRGLTFIGQGLAAPDCRNLTVADCQIRSSSGDGMFCSGSGLFITGNRASACAKSALWIEGDGLVSNNIIGPGCQFGLRLGNAWRLGTMSVINNYIEGAQVGIAVSSSEAGYAFIAMNMITGAKNGGIRALSNNELTGKDLTKGGSEAFRNFAIAANVSL